MTNVKYKKELQNFIQKNYPSTLSDLACFFISKSITDSVYLNEVKEHLITKLDDNRQSLMGFLIYFRIRKNGSIGVWYVSHCCSQDLNSQIHSAIRDQDSFKPEDDENKYQITGEMFYYDCKLRTFTTYDVQYLVTKRMCRIYE